MDAAKFLELIRGAIAIKNIPKKTLARRCKLTRPQFSEIIHGDRPMPAEVRSRLISELGLESCIAKIMDELNIRGKACLLSGLDNG